MQSPNPTDERADAEVALQELRTELTKIKTMIMAGGAIESPGRSKVLRRAIAKILTVINEEE